MSRTCHFIRNYPFSCIIIAAIWVLCLIPIPETPLDNVSMIDKWTHVVMCGGLCIVIWAEYLWRHHAIKKRKVLLGTFLAPVLMGGLLEILQATCTGGRRSGEWLDWLADGVGVIAGGLIGILLAACRATARRGKPAGGNCKTDGRR